MEPSTVAQWLSPRLACPGSHMGTGSIPAALLPFQLPARGPGEQSRTTQSKSHLASDQHSIGRCAHLGSESSDGSSSLSLLYVYPPFQ